MSFPHDTIVHERSPYVWQQLQTSSQAALGGKRQRNVTVTFVKYSEMGAGKRWKTLVCGSDFLLEAKEFIIRSWGLESTQDDLHLACYVEGVKGRVEFDHAKGYWALDPSSPVIYFWIGAKEDSPPCRMESLEKQLDRLNGDVKRLKTASAAENYT